MVKTSWQKELSSLCFGAGNILKRLFNRPHQIEIKPGAGIVTEADKQTEAYLIRQILRKFPNSSIITEETGEISGGSELLWVIDPLDGTSNYAHGFPWFCVSIGVLLEGKLVAGGIYHPLMEEFFFGEKGKGSFLNRKRLKVSRQKLLGKALLGTGFYYSKKKQLAEEIKIFHRLNELAAAVRRPGSAALDLACVASGRFDGFWERGLSSWDIAAGLLLVQEAGGKVTDYQGKSATLESRSITASNGRLHNELLKAISA